MREIKEPFEFRYTYPSLDWYDVKKVRSALMILGSDVTAWEDSRQPMRGLHLESGEGVGVILPVRLIGEKELN